MTKEEIIKYLNDLNIVQTNVDFWDEDVSDDIWQTYLEGAELVDSDLYADTHRWYELSITVFKVDDWYLGVKHICQLFSEESEAGDIGHILNFFEMEQVPSVTYIRKND
jgi:hypothetical protein